MTFHLRCETYEFGEYMPHRISVNYTVLVLRWLGDVICGHQWPDLPYCSTYFVTQFSMGAFFVEQFTMF